MLPDVPTACIVPVLAVLMLSHDSYVSLLGGLVFELPPLLPLPHAVNKPPAIIPRYCYVVSDK